MALGKSSKKQPVTTEATQPTGLPLFFKQPSVLDATRHAHATITPSEDYSFARKTNSIGVNTLEFIEASKHYPIVFDDSEANMPAVIVGWEQSNSFVGADGAWLKDTYIPAYVRQYPFIFFEQTEQERFYLCVDEASPHYSEKKKKDAKPLFNEDGSPSELSNHALEFCSAFYQHHTLTKNFCADLRQHALLKPYHSEATLDSGKTLKLSGFMMIDETAFNALSDDVILDFRKKGWLPFIYLALASASNWRRLLDLASSTN